MFLFVKARVSYKNSRTGWLQSNAAWLKEKEKEYRQQIWKHSFVSNIVFLNTPFNETH